MTLSRTPVLAASPIGVHRQWKEDFVESCARRIGPAIEWNKIGPVDMVNISVKAPTGGGIYVFVRKSKLEKLTPFGSYPLIVYVGLAANLRARLLKYVDDKRIALRYTEGSGKIRSGIRSMFREYRDALEIYIFECNQLDRVSVEDTLIKILDPIFNEAQKLSNEIEESEDGLAGHVGAPETAYSNEGSTINSSDTVPGRLCGAEPAF